MKKLIIIFIISVILIAGCEVNPSKIGTEEANNFASKLTFVKDDVSGLCFAVVASRKTGNTDQNGLGITIVPCEEVGL